MDTETFNQCDQIIWKAAHKLRKATSPALFDYTFGEIEDAYQYGWVCLSGDKKLKQLTNSISAYGGLLYTALYCDLHDYVRHVCGREKTTSNKRKALLNLFSTSGFPFDSDPLHDERGEITADQKKMVDTWQVPMDTDEHFKFTLSCEIVDFLNKKLTRKEQEVARLLFVEGWNQKEVGRKFALTESRVSQIQKKIKEQVLRRYD